LQDLADLNLIVFKPTEDSLDNAIKRIRKKAAQNPPSQEEIIREVEIVREKRYGRKKG
jgi:DNA-binding response OmpR family regulator